MNDETLVLLRGRAAEAYCDAHPEPVRPLSDGVLAHLAVPFAELQADVRQAAYFLHHALGEKAVAMHDDPRGLLVLPEGADPRAEDYDGVVTEMRAGAHWVPLPTREQRAEFEAERMRTLPEQLADILRLKTLLEEVARAEQSGDPDEIRRAEAKLPEALRAQRERLRAERAKPS